MSVQVDPYTFVNGTVANALEVNARFDNLYNLQNGAIDSANMNLAASFAWTGAHSFTVTNTTTNSVSITSNSLTTGSSLAITSNSSDTSARNIVSIIQDHASATSANAFYIRQDSISTVSIFESTFDGNTGPISQYYHNSVSPAVNDSIVQLQFYGNSSTGVLRNYANIFSQILDPTNTSEDANIGFQTMVAGTIATRGGFFGDSFFIGRTSGNSIVASQLDVLSTSINLAVFETTDAGSNGPIIRMYHNSASPSNNDAISYFISYGNSSTGVTRQYSNIYTEILDTTNASEDAQIVFQTMKAGSLLTSFIVGNNFSAVIATNKLFFDGGGNTSIDEVSADVLRTIVGGTEIMRLDTSSVLIRRTAANAIGTASVDVLTSGTIAGVFESINNAPGGPSIYLFHNSPASTNGDYNGTIFFYGNSSTGVKRDYGEINSIILDQTNTSEDSKFVFSTMIAGSVTDTFSLASTGIGVISGSKMFLDGVSQAGDTYFRETIANEIHGVAGGKLALWVTTSSMSDTQSSLRLLAQPAGGGSDTNYAIKIGAANSGGAGFRMLKIDN